MKSRLFIITILLAFPSLGLTKPVKPVKSEITLSGQVSLWSKSVCGNHRTCHLPSPLEISWPVSIQIQRPAFEGEKTIKEITLEERNWRVHLLIAWIRPANGETPYRVIQTRLSENLLGVIAECSRYDSETAFSTLPPGSCSGRAASAMYGVSFLPPAK